MNKKKELTSSPQHVLNVCNSSLCPWWSHHHATLCPHLKTPTTMKNIISSELALMQPPLFCSTICPSRSLLLPLHYPHIICFAKAIWQDVTWPCGLLNTIFLFSYLQSPIKTILWLVQHSFCCHNNSLSLQLLFCVCDYSVPATW